MSRRKYIYFLIDFRSKICIMSLMRAKKAKQIRKILGVLEHRDNKILRRTYRRFKKLYSRTKEKDKATLLSAIQNKFNLKKQ